nr:RNA-directed DNA polymerase, eukaryota [Tanacetum cinerariifolium]
AGESQELEDPEEIPLEDIFEEIKNTVSRRISKGESSNLNQKAPMLIDQGNGTKDLVKERTGHLKHFQDINNRRSLDMAQKAKIRWSIEGNENSKYFHGILSKKRSQLAIRGVLADGDWIDEPAKVKNEFLNHFTNRFSKPVSPKILLDSQMLHTLASEQVDDLERNVTYGEIKMAVWDCGTNKSPVEEFFDSSYFPPGCNASFITLIPKMQDAKLVKDFRPITLIGCIYKIVAKILASRLSLVISLLVSDVQSAFVSSRQILDGPFILNELISWSKAKKSKVMIFKIDFEKAFDSVRWDFLDDTLVKFGFGSKWRGWIQGCLNSAKGSILVNRSPTLEFKFHKGLKQGDPLSPFLFILIMESLHFLFSQIINAGLFKGIRIDNSLTLSHLFYADDAVFIGKWDRSNLITITNMLKCFFMASGLKINIHKSKIMGIGVPHEDVISAANLIGCSTLSRPLNYLGVKVGGSSSRINYWDEDSSLWSRLIKAMYGDCGSIDNPNFFSRTSPWSDIIKEVVGLSLKGINLLSFIKKKVGSGDHTCFWKDIWLDDRPLKLCFPRLFALECDKNVIVSNKIRDPSLFSSFRREPRGGIEEEQHLNLVEKVASVILSNSADRWSWSLASSGEFSVKTACSHIDDILLPLVGAATRWVPVVPIKINVFAWKVCWDFLPTRFNLSLRGLDIHSILCPVCHSAGESSSHLFFSCNVAHLLIQKVARWWESDVADLFSYDDWLTGLSGLRLAKGTKSILEGVFYVMWWVIWKFRNQILFGSSQPRRDLIFDEIVLLSYTWCSSRCKSTFDWTLWLKSPRSLSL